MYLIRAYKQGGETMRKIELLAPSGDKESLIAAIQNGADAVYLGGDSFNARASVSLKQWSMITFPPL